VAIETQRAYASETVLFGCSGPEQCAPFGAGRAGGGGLGQLVAAGEGDQGLGEGEDGQP